MKDRVFWVVGWLLFDLCSLPFGLHFCFAYWSIPFQGSLDPVSVRIQLVCEITMSRMKASDGKECYM